MVNKMIIDEKSKDKSYFGLFKYYQKLKDSFSKAVNKSSPYHRKIRKPIEGLFKYRAVEKENEILRKKIEELEEEKKQAELKNQELHQEVEQLKQENEERNNIDFLTQIQNRRGFNDSLALKIASAMVFNKSISLLIFDLDNFKECNDNLGHPEGDKCLQRFSSILTNQIRKEDTASRLGGDEFAVILYDTNITNAKEAAERIRKNLIDQDISFEAIDNKTGKQERKQVSSSAGIFYIDKEQWDKATGFLGIDRQHLKQAYANLDRKVTFIGDKKIRNDFEKVIKENIMPVIYQEADATLYMAKKDGKNCVRVREAQFERSQFEQIMQSQDGISSSTTNKNFGKSSPVFER